jgi:holin (3TMs family)
VGLLQNILGGTLLSSVKGLIDEFHASPELKAQMQAAANANALQIKLSQDALESKLQDTLAREIEAASANIRADAASGDKYTSRARPSFIYVVLVILSCNYIVFPLAGKAPLAFPDAFFWLFGSCMLGYTGARTWEKIAILTPGK